MEEKLKKNGFDEWGDRLSRASSGILGFLFEYDERKSGRRGAAVWLTLLFLAGSFLWGQFLNWGAIPFNFHDWAEISAPRVAFLRDAALKGQLPLHMPDGSALRNLTDRYMALPDVMLSPQFLLLGVMEPGRFLLVNTWLLFGLGTLGLDWFRRKFRWSPFTFTVVFLLFNFNGSILTHFSVGHINYSGYFLFPWLAALIILLLERTDPGGWLHGNWIWTALTSGLLFFMLLQGSFHQFVWSLMLLGLLGLFSWRLLPVITRTLAATCLLSAVRILPPALELGKFDNEFLSGYTSLTDLFNAMVSLRGPVDAFKFTSMLSSLGWWEFDLYIGLAGTAVVLVFGLWHWLRNLDSSDSYPELLLPMAALFVLSIGRIYKAVMLLPIPLFAGERVSARILSLPFAILILFAGINLQKWLNRKLPGSTRGWALLGMLAVLGNDLWQNLKLWRVNVAAEAFPTTPVDLTLKVVSNHFDAAYSTVLLIGAAFSLITLGGLIAAGWREKAR